MRIAPVIQQQPARVGHHFFGCQDAVAQFRRQGFGRDDEAVGGDYRLLQARPQVTGVAVGSNHHLLGRHARAACGADLPMPVLPRQAGDQGVAVDGDAMRLRRTHQAAAIAERLDAAGAPINPAADVGWRADALRHLAAFQYVHRRAAFGPLCGAFDQCPHDLL